MKYIFDFDDVLFNNTVQFKKHMYACLEDAGISYEVAFAYYKTMRHEFSVKLFLAHFGADNIYEKIMSKCPDFLNTELISAIKEKGEDNCYMVTHGTEDYQLEKIKRTGITSLFSEIIVVQDSKKESIEKICAKHSDEIIIFIDDKEKHFESLNFKKCPNLKTILYTGQDLKPYLQ